MDLLARDLFYADDYAPAAHSLKDPQAITDTAVIKQEPISDRPSASKR